MSIIKKFIESFLLLRYSIFSFKKLKINIFKTSKNKGSIFPLILHDIPSNQINYFKGLLVKLIKEYNFLIALTSIVRFLFKNKYEFKSSTLSFNKPSSLVAHK